MFKRFFAGLVLAFFGFSAHAGIVTLSDFILTWTPGTTPGNGGGAIVHYDDGSMTWSKSFQVNVKPFITSINDTSQGVNDWLTPTAGSGYTFDPVDLYGIFGEARDVYETSTGVGDWADSLAYLNNGIKSPFDKTELGFFRNGTNWQVTKVDQQVSNVPEPGSLALLSIGMIGGLAATRRKQKKIGITTRRMYQVGNHLDTMKKNKPSGNRGFIIELFIRYRDEQNQ